MSRGVANLVAVVLALLAGGARLAGRHLLVRRPWARRLWWFWCLLWGGPSPRTVGVLLALFAEVMSVLAWTCSPRDAEALGEVAVLAVVVALVLFLAELLLCAGSVCGRWVAERRRARQFVVRLPAARIETARRVRGARGS